MSDSDYDKITPAELDLPPRRTSREIETPADAAPLGSEEARQWEAYRRRNTRILWGVFGVLVMLAAGVMLILPRYVSPGAGNPAPAVAVNPASRPAVSGPAVSPYQEAQLMQQREDAQEALAELLELQDALETREVESWAAEDFGRAVEQARAGDEAYRRQQFLEAGNSYREGVAILRDIEGRSGQVFAGLMDEGGAAILDGDAAMAREAFRLASVIDPDSAEARAGAERAGVLDQVLALLEEGAALTQAGELEAARERFRQALVVDAEHAGAAEALERIAGAIVERDFTASMSRGYGLLQGGRPEEAATAFKQALALKPQSPEAQAGIEQAEDQRASAIINRHLAAGQEHESAERWAQALEEYNQALAVDPNVVPAVQGRDRSESRLALDTFLSGVIDAPLRLADDAVYEQARQVYANALRIPDPGARLREQLGKVDGLLAKAREPVNVSLVSDGLTSVTVYRVGSLGQFTNQTVDLTPGTYTAVGIREGYRDVREEFVVAFDEPPPVVTVVCDEAI